MKMEENLPINKYADAAVGDLHTVGIEGDRWKRVVIVVDVKDSLNIRYLNDDPNQLLITVTPPENTGQGG